MEIGEIFVELSGEVRREILSRLDRQEFKLKALSDELGEGIQEIHRNVCRLQAKGLLTKNRSGAITLTPFGRIILQEITCFEFLTRNSEYFEEHSLGDVPEIQVMALAALSNSTPVEGVVRVISTWKDIYNNAREYVYATKAQVSLDMIAAISEAINNGVRYSYILGQDVIVPKGRTELLKRLRWKDLIARGLVERRMAKSTPVVVVLNEKEASVLFPGLNGKADLNKMFYSKDPVFQEWCLNYFRWKWQNSEMFEESKVLEK